MAYEAIDCGECAGCKLKADLLAALTKVHEMFLSDLREQHERWCAYTTRLFHPALIGCYAFKVIMTEDRVDG